VNDYSEDATLRSIEDSLKRLKTDHVEIAWVHDVAQDFYGDDWLGMFESARKGAFRALDRLRYPELTVAPAKARIPTSSSPRHSSLIRPWARVIGPQSSAQCLRKPDFPRRLAAWTYFTKGQPLSFGSM
jgi:hypothetical protein